MPEPIICVQLSLTHGKNQVYHSLPKKYVLQLTENIHCASRNVTVDDCFSSCELAKELVERKLTIVGTMRKNKADIQPQPLETKRKPISSSQFVFDKLQPWYPLLQRKIKQQFCFLPCTCEKNPFGVSEAADNLFYKDTKGGVDTFDQLCHSKTLARKNRRWPLRVFVGCLMLQE